MDPVKVQAVRDWTPFTKLKEVRSFIRFANFYQRFIKDFSKICWPLHDLTKKDVPFVWGPAQQAAFETLKAAFMSKPVLARATGKGLIYQTAVLLTRADTSDH
jgi:hypothetical protein